MLWWSWSSFKCWFDSLVYFGMSSSWLPSSVDVETKYGSWLVGMVINLIWADVELDVWAWLRLSNAIFGAWYISLLYIQSFLAQSLNLTNKCQEKCLSKCHKRLTMFFLKINKQYCIAYSDWSTAVGIQHLVQSWKASNYSPYCSSIETFPH